LLVDLLLRGGKHIGEMGEPTSPESAA